MATELKNCLKKHLWADKRSDLVTLVCVKREGLVHERERERDLHEHTIHRRSDISVQVLTCLLPNVVCLVNLNLLGSEDHDNKDHTIRASTKTRGISAD